MKNRFIFFKHKTKNILESITKKLTRKLVDLQTFPIIEIDYEQLSPEAREVYDDIIRKMFPKSNSNIIDVQHHISELEFQEKYGDWFIDLRKK